MTTYRALSNLSGVARRGELTPLTHLNAEQIAKLERVGAIARIGAPPLSELPGWAIRAGKLAKVDILTAEELLEAPLEVIVKALRVKPETAAQYQQDIAGFLVIQDEPEE
jgi:hypothetical protein